MRACLIGLLAAALVSGCESDTSPSGAPDATPAGDAGGDSRGVGECALACEHGGACVGGLCECPDGFDGPTCGDCAAGRFGATCEPCACLNGACADGLDGDGSCACLDGWLGPRCGRVDDDPVIPWDATGPYGVGIRDRVADFEFTDGDGGTTSLSELWTGEDSFLFVMRYAQSSTNTQVWEGSVQALLEACPPNTQLVFGSYDAEFASQLDAMKGRVGQALLAMGPDAQAHWGSRVHYLYEQGVFVEGSFGAFVNALGQFWFGIDRHQRWRQVGSLYDFPSGNQVLAYVGYEAQGFEFEARMTARREALETAGLAVPIWTPGDRHPGGWGAGYGSRWDVPIPDAEALAPYDAMELHLYTGCPGHLQGKDAGCNEWDFIQDIKICDVPVPAAPEDLEGPCQPVFDPGDGGEVTPADTIACECLRADGAVAAGAHTCAERDDGIGYGECSCGCSVELARQVTTYGREGEWITDLSPLMPLVSQAAGETLTLRFGGANGYDLEGGLLFHDTGAAERAVAVQELWSHTGGMRFDLDYNGKHEPLTVEVPDGATRVELVVVVSGHGHSSTVENCAEFCNHQHLFTVDGDATFLVEHPTAGQTYGCRDRIAEGTVPNQFGTWVFGRAGWCAGMDIPLDVRDVTAVMTPGTHTVSYEGLYFGIPYSPSITDPGGYLPEIKLATWLVVYGPRP